MTSTAYKLHYAPDNASLVIRLALEELGQPYEAVLVDRRHQAQRTKDYLALNPNGLIPVLETPQGPIFETAAILLWLVDTHKALGPGPDAPDRADFLKWLFFLSNTLHPALRRMFYAHNYIGDNACDQDQLRAVTRARIQDHLRLLNDRWQSGPPPARALTLYLAPMLRWLALYPARTDRSWYSLAAYPALYQAAKELEPTAAVSAARMAEGLGDAPFTAPQPPNPPEGSAT